MEVLEEMQTDFRDDEPTPWQDIESTAEFTTSVRVLRLRVYPQGRSADAHAMLLSRFGLDEALPNAVVERTEVRL